MRVLGVNAIFHDPSAALVVDGRIVAAAEEERFSRRKHGKRPVPFSAWELPDAGDALVPGARPGCAPQDLDAVAYSFDPALASPPGAWVCPTRGTTCGSRTPSRPRASSPPRCRGWTASRCASCPTTSRMPPRPGSPPRRVTGAAPACSCSTAAASAPPTSPVATSDGRLETLAGQALPHSLGLLYESLTEHLGFLRSSDEFKVMALASYGTPRHLDQLRETDPRHRRRRVRRARARLVAVGAGRAAPTRRSGPPSTPTSPRSVQAVPGGGAGRAGLLAARAHRRPDPDHGRRHGAELRCQHAGSGGRRRSSDVWVQPAAGDAGTSLGAALQLSRRRRRAGAAASRPPRSGGAGATTSSPPGCAAANVPFTTPGRHRRRGGRRARRRRCRRLVRRPQRVRAARARPPLADGPPRPRREPRAAQRRQGPRAVPAGGADGAGRPRAEIFTDGPMPSPYMLFVHDVRRAWRERIPAVVHVDGTARIQTVDDDRRPRVAALLRAFERRTGLPVVVNTSLNTAGSADGRRPPRRARAVRVRAGRRAGRSARIWSSVAEHVRDPGPPDDGRHRPAVRRGGPDRGPAQPDRLLGGLAARPRTGARGGRGGRRPARRRRAAGRCDAAVSAALRRQGAAGPRPRARRGAQPRLAGRVGAVGGLPRRRRRAGAARGARTCVADLAACAGRRGGVARHACTCPCRATGGPTDWERSTAGPGDARAGSPPTWPTAARRWWRCSGFDERFPRAYREDADLALRVQHAGLAAAGRRPRTTTHPVRPADDVGQRARAARQRRRRLMRRLHGRGWRRRAGDAAAAGSAGTQPPWRRRAARRRAGASPRSAGRPATRLAGPAPWPGSA